MTTLRSDPPLPGEPTAGWAGLEDEAQDQPSPEADADSPDAGSGVRAATNPPQSPQHRGH